MKIEFHNKVAVVTGGAGGIGEACVEELLDSGAKVAVVDVSETMLKQLSDRLERRNIRKKEKSDIID